MNGTGLTGNKMCADRQSNMLFQFLSIEIFIWRFCKSQLSYITHVTWMNSKLTSMNEPVQRASHYEKKNHQNRIFNFPTKKWLEKPARQHFDAICCIYKFLPVRIDLFGNRDQTHGGNMSFVCLYTAVVCRSVTSLLGRAETKNIPKQTRRQNKTHQMHVMRAHRTPTTSVTGTLQSNTSLSVAVRLPVHSWPPRLHYFLMFFVWRKIAQLIFIGTEHEEKNQRWIDAKAKAWRRVMWTNATTMHIESAVFSVSFVCFCVLVSQHVEC